MNGPKACDLEGPVQRPQGRQARPQTPPTSARAPDARARIDEPGEATALAQGARVGISRPHESAHLHVAGEATYIDDIPELAGTLHCALGLSPVAHGKLTGMTLAVIRAMPGVVAVLSADDIPGSNDCGSIIHDDPILCDGEIRYLGQPVFAVIAETRKLHPYDNPALVVLPIAGGSADFLRWIAEQTANAG